MAFRKAPKVDPAMLAPIQARITPWIADLQRQAWGNPKAFQQIPAQITQRLAAEGVRLPPGYAVNMDGEVVYTNQTPGLQQLAWAALPFAGGQAASSLAGLYGGPAAIASQGASQGLAQGGRMGLWGTLGKFFGSPGGQVASNLAGDLIGATLQTRGANRASDIQDRYNREALEFLRSQDARDYAEYLKERERGWRFEEEDRTRGEEDRQLKLLREREREGRLGPFRQGAERGYQTLSGLLLDPNQRLAQSPPVSGATTRRLSDLMR